MSRPRRASLVWAAAFAAAAFVFVVVAIFALERVGAPDPLVAAL